MDISVKDRPLCQARPMSELLPSLTCILSEGSIHSLTAMKKPRNTVAVSRSVEKVLKPLTYDEMKSAMDALNEKSKRPVQSMSTSKKRNWNSSVKLETKTKSITANGGIKNKSVRKMLNFKETTTTRKTFLNPETPKLPTPDSRLKKPGETIVKFNVSKNNALGTQVISETPVIKRTTKRITMTNKENVSFLLKPNHNRMITPRLDKKQPRTPKSILKRSIPSLLIDMSQLDASGKSDESFIQREKEINEVEEKSQTINKTLALGRISEVSPPVSTPCKEYRNVNDYFNTSETLADAVLDDSALYNDNTILSFDNTHNSKEGNKREETVIMSLCELLSKANVNIDCQSAEVEKLMEIEKEIQNGINKLTHIKESQIKALQSVRKLIQERQSQDLKKDQPPPKDDANVNLNNNDSKQCEVVPTPRCSVIKSPTYKIPKKNFLLRRKVLHNTTPNKSNIDLTPVKVMDSRALSMYMQMKQNMNFLNTPLVQHHEDKKTKTQSVTSINLQRQLDQLYKNS